MSHYSLIVNKSHEKTKNNKALVRLSVLLEVPTLFVALNPKSIGSC